MNYRIKLDGGGFSGHHNNPFNFHYYESIKYLMYIISTIKTIIEGQIKYLKNTTVSIKRGEVVRVKCDEVNTFYMRR